MWCSLILSFKVLYFFFAPFCYFWQWLLPFSKFTLIHLHLLFNIIFLGYYKYIEKPIYFHVFKVFYLHFLQHCSSSVFIFYMYCRWEALSLGECNREGKKKRKQLNWTWIKSFQTDTFITALISQINVLVGFKLFTVEWNF